LLAKKKMKIFLDITSGDELFSDALPVTLLKDIVYKVEGKYVLEGGDCGIASNEEDGGGVDDQAVRVVNVVTSHKLQETTLSKKDYMTYIKAYSAFLLNKFKESNAGADLDAKVKVFQTALGAFVKDVLGRFDEFLFFTGENASNYTFSETQLVLSDFSADGLTPYFYFFKHGLREEKC